MSDNITWGDPIEVNGKRPVWLGADVQMQWATVFKDGTYGVYVAANSDTCANWTGGADRGVAVRLPADHFVYTVLRWNAEHPDEQPFEPWGGGDAAPGDWDGGDTLLRSGRLYPMYPHCPYDWTHGVNLTDIIGYRRKRVSAQPATPESVGIFPTYDPATHVAVPRMTESEAQKYADRYGYAPNSIAFAHYVGALHDLGIIRPDPTPLDRFKAAHPDWALRDREDLIADVIAWREVT